MTSVTSIDPRGRLHTARALRQRPLLDEIHHKWSPIEHRGGGGLRGGEFFAMGYFAAVLFRMQS